MFSPVGPAVLMWRLADVATPPDPALPSLSIVLVYDEWHGDEPFGGIVRYLTDLAEGLSARGHRVTVLTCGAVDPDATHAYRLVPVTPPPRTSNRALTIVVPILRSWRYHRALRDLARRGPIDVVEFSNWGSGGLVPSFRKRAAQVTRIVTMGWQSRGDVTGRPLPHRLADWCRDWIEAAAIKRSDLVLVPSPSHGSIVAKKLGLRTTPEAVALGSATESGGGDEVVRAPAPMLLFVGRLEKRKGFDLMVRAFADLHQEPDDEVRLVVVGADTPTGPSGGSFADHAMRGLDDATRARIELRGWVEEDDLARLYGQAWALVIPSRYESFGLTAVEAMRHRTPVVAAAAGGLLDIVSPDSGVLFDPADPSALVAALERIIAEPGLRDELARAGYERFSANYTREAFVKRTENAYRRLVAAREH